MEHGTLDTPVEYLCEVAHTQAKFLGLINANEKAWEVKDWERRIEGLSGTTSNLCAKEAIYEYKKGGYL
jgi:hypothetical protein